MGEKFSKIMCDGLFPEHLEFCLSLIFRVVGSNKGEPEMDTVSQF